MIAKGLEILEVLEKIKDNEYAIVELIDKANAMVKITIKQN